MYIKYSRKDGDRKIVSTRFVTGKILCSISTMTVKWNAFHIWSSSEMYLQVQQNLHTICCSVAFLCSHETKEKKKSSLCPYPTVLTLCQRGLQGPGVQDLHAWISHLFHEQVHDSASVSVDFSQAQVEKEKKNSKLHPQEEVGSNSLSPQSKGKRGRNISET